MADWSELDRRVTDELGPELRIVRPLGRGAVASVYLAREQALDRPVAVKVLSPSQAREPTVRKRFEREARSAARITHRNVTSVHRVGRLSDGLPFLVMEYVDGKNLEDSLAATGPVSEEEARDILGQLAEALAAAHEQDIIHRDLKPANVLREKATGRVVLTDFGLAAARDAAGLDTTRLTMQGQVLGDLGFVSPEHLRGEELTELADIYALGVLAYHLLTGVGPYEGKSPADITEACLRKAPIPLERLRPEIDGQLAALIARCLAKRPEQRPSAEDLVRELAPEAVDGAGGSGAPVHTSALGQFFGELQRRHVYKVGAAYLAVALAVIGLTEGVQTPLDVSDATSRVIVGMLLAGFPVTLALSWMFDIRAGRITRTADVEAGGALRRRIIPAAGLLFSLVLAALIWRWVLQRGAG